jgi:hypothetical protein
MPERTAQPLSPELILVSPAEEAARAREQLPDPPERGPEAEPVATDPSETTWNDFLADVRNRPAEPVTETRAVPRPPLRVRRNGRKRLLVAAVALLAVGAAVALGWAWDRGQQQPKSAASSPPVAPHSQAAAPKPKAHAKTTPAPAVTPASKPKKSPKPSSSHGAGFVPTRVWSWAAAPGAGAYVVRFLREGHKVLKIRTGSARLQLPSSFTFSPGRYRWTVTAIPSKGKGAHVIVNSAFTVG